jgi:hypothetical protein
MEHHYPQIFPGENNQGLHYSAFRPFLAHHDPNKQSLITGQRDHRRTNPRSRANEEGWNPGRYGAYHDLENWRRYLSAAGFVELTHYYGPPGLPRERQPWLASVWRRLAS